MLNYKQIGTEKRQQNSWLNSTLHEHFNAWMYVAFNVLKNKWKKEFLIFNVLRKADWGSYFLTPYRVSIGRSYRVVSPFSVFQKKKKKKTVNWGGIAPTQWAIFLLDQMDFHWANIKKWSTFNLIFGEWVFEKLLFHTP